jgi:hypothetical protein
MLLVLGVAYAFVIPGLTERCCGGPCFNGFWCPHKLLLPFLAEGHHALNMVFCAWY